MSPYMQLLAHRREIRRYEQIQRRQRALRISVAQLVAAQFDGARIYAELAANAISSLDDTPPTLN